MSGHHRDAGSAAWIEEFAQRITEQIEADHAERNREAGKDVSPPFAGEDVLARIRKHSAPAWVWRFDTEPDEAEARLDHDADRDQQRRLHDDGRQAIRQHVAEHDGEARCPLHPPRANVVRIALDERAAVSDPRERWDVENPHE